MKVPTQINLPITIPLKDISNQINKSFNGLIYEDQSFENNNQDLVKIKVWKIDNLNINSISNEKLEINVPIKIWISKQINILGIKKEQELSFSLSLKFNTELSFESSWKVNSKTNFKSYTWINKPKLSLGIIKIPISYFVNKILNEKLKEIGTDIDKKIKEKIDIKNHIIKGWNDLSKPFLISDEYQTWLKVTPIDICATQLKITNQTLNTILGFKVYSETFFGTKPEESTLIKKIPDLNIVSILNPLFLFKTTVNISYNKSVEIISDKIKNKEFLIKDKYKIKIIDFDLYPAEDKIIINLKVKGSFSGNIFLESVPYYDYKLQEIKLKDVKLNVKTYNLVYKMASWFLDSKIEKTIENNYGIPCKEILNLAKNNIQKEINKIEIPNFELSSNIESISPYDILVEPENLLLVIDIKSRLHLKMK